MFRQALLMVLVVGISSFALAEDPPGAKGDAADLVRLAEKLKTGEKDKDRIEAGIELAWVAPDVLAKALDEMIEEPGEDDCEVVAQIAVETKVRHVRLLLVYAASKLGNAGEVFLDRIDNDYPQETNRAVEALGFLREGAALDQLLSLLRSEDEFTAIQAARALARVATKKDGKKLVEAALNCDHRHARGHIAWAVQDAVGSKGTATTMFGRYKNKKGTMGFRAGEILGTLQDELSPAESYKVKLKEVRKFFTPRGGTKPPVVAGMEDSAKGFRDAMEMLKQKTPAYHHLVCAAISKITLTGSEKRFNHRARTVNFRPAEVLRWKDRDGKPYLNLYAYYLVRYSVIMFLAQMGDPAEGHRGWEEGIVEAWHFAIDHTDVAVNEKLEEYMQEVLRKPPW